MAKQVLLCPPAYFDVIDRKNPYMEGKLPGGSGGSQRQWQALCFRARGKQDARFETIAPAPGLEDMVLCRESGFCGVSMTGLGKFIVPSRMVHGSRQREVAILCGLVPTNAGFRVVELDLGDDHLEGHGDLLWHPDWVSHLCRLWFSFDPGRASKHFARRCSKLGIPVVPSSNSSTVTAITWILASARSTTRPCSFIPALTPPNL